MLPDLNYEPFKEPRGFLKILQWVFCICAFATTTNFSALPSVHITCTVNNNITGHLEHAIQYPFALDHEQMTTNVLPCKNGTAIPNHEFLDCGPIGNAKADSEFFVTTGVLTFLYTTGMIGFYLLADRSFSENYARIDFCVTILFAIFWFSSSSAWANGLPTVKSGSDPNNWQLAINLEAKPTDVSYVKLCDEAHTGYKCDQFVYGSFGGLVISILFGFINFILWAGNLWFLYKETPWFDNNTNAASPAV